MTELWTFNGVDGRSGDYLLQASPQDLVRVAKGAPLDPRSLGELKYRHRTASESHFGVKEGVDPTNLAETGWGAVFPATRPGTPEAAQQAAIREALSPLLDLRRAQATRLGDRFRVYEGAEGYRPGESKQQFLARHGAGPGPADPDKVPYYLLLVGDPVAIPFRIQSQVGVQYAVGRLCFATASEYAAYAASVVAAETGAPPLPRKATFFSVGNPDDGATQASSKHLVPPLVEALSASRSDWSLDHVAPEAAQRAALESCLRDEAPALLFTASHGMGFPKDDPLQLRHQGALLCQDWPGPKEWRGKPIPEDHYLAGDHLASDVNLLGTIGFLFACYGGGSPELDEFSKQAWTERAAIAPHSFVGALPQAMLNRPKGGALAVIGHVERAWGHSFLWAGTGDRGGAGSQITVFQSTLESLMAGTPVGAAMEYFSQRYAELASDLSVELEEMDYGAEVDEYALAGLWTANNDARGYAVFGDPAVRLNVASDAGERPPLESIELSQAPREASAPASPQPTAKAQAAVDPTTLQFGLSASPGDADALLQAALERIAALGPREVRTYAGGETAEDRTLLAHTRLDPLGDVTTFLPDDAEPSAATLAHHERMVAAANERSLRVVEALLALLRSP